MARRQVGILWPVRAHNGRSIFGFRVRAKERVSQMSGTSTELAKKPAAPNPGTNWSVLLGAAFIMATSAIGPGFLTQTAVFTEQFKANFAFAILISIIIDIGAQLTIWRVITMAGKRGQDIANDLLPGLGYLLAFLIALGGLAFNIGNIGGTAMGTNALFGINLQWGAAISAVVAIAIFWLQEAGKAMDTFAKYLGFIMIAVTGYIAIITGPPVGEAVVRAVAPTNINFLAITTLVGGTVGGYITFAGAHRLLDADVKGVESLPKVSRASITGIALTGVMRVILFLAVLGVVAKGFKLDPANPPASAFKFAAGNLGYKFFGLVMWSAAITSVVGAAYTSVTFLQTLFKPIAAHRAAWITGFIVVSTFMFLFVPKPVTLLILAGSLNGLILPLSLGIMLWASKQKRIIGDYKHPHWMLAFGVAAFAIATWAGWQSLAGIKALLK